MNTEESPNLGQVASMQFLATLWCLHFYLLALLESDKFLPLLSLPSWSKALLFPYWDYCHGLLLGVSASAHVSCVESNTNRVILLKFKSDHVILFTASNVFHSFTEIKCPIHLFYMALLNLLPSSTIHFSATLNLWSHLPLFFALLSLLNRLPCFSRTHTYS